MRTDDFDSLAARADVARLLAACYYEPSTEFAEERLFDALAEAANRVDPALADPAQRLGEAFAAESANELLIDYTRLFLGPVAALAQPYGSVWLERRQSLMQESTQAVIALYAEAGFEAAEDFRDLPDHIAAELEFLYLLLFRRAEAARNADAASAMRHAELQRRFLAEHLGRWVGPFTAEVGAGAQTALYRQLAQLTDAFVRSESDTASGAG
jgi:TorA maturation chaperone TorD